MQLVTIPTDGPVKACNRNGLLHKMSLNINYMANVQNISSNVLKIQCFVKVLPLCCSPELIVTGYARYHEWEWSESGIPLSL